MIGTRDTSLLLTLSDFDFLALSGLILLLAYIAILLILLVA
jgi:hypothetical protein